MKMSKFYISGRNQTRTATPSNIQQTITPQEGFNALDAVVVNPIKAAMPQTLEQFIMRDDNTELFSLNLDGVVPDYACYQQKKLVVVYGIITEIKSYAFHNCTALSEIDLSETISISGRNALSSTAIQKIVAKKLIYIAAQTFADIVALQTADLRLCQTIFEQSFLRCTNLTHIDIRSATTIDAQSFVGCNSLILIDITSTHNCVLRHSNAIPNNANLVILVADATDKAYYQSATNWSAYASEIKTVTEYEQQIGMSYDDYYEIIFGHPRFDNAA